MDTCLPVVAAVTKFLIKVAKLVTYSVSFTKVPPSLGWTFPLGKVSGGTSHNTKCSTSLGIS